MKSCLVDTGVLYALFAANDRWHDRVRDFANTYPGRLLLAACVVPEAAYLVNKYLGQRAEIDLLNAITRGDFVLEELQVRDYSRAAVLMAQHEKLNIGFVDAANVAVCERLKITDFATTDRRHFGAVRPQHCKRLTLLP